MASFSVERRGLSQAAKRGATGAAGATGATGNGAVFTSVDSLHASPRSVTDWGATINTQIAAGVTHFVFGPFDYPFTTSLTPNISPGAAGVYLQGTSMMKGDPSSHGARTRLIWNGTGSGAFIDASLVTPGWGGGHVFEDMHVLYSSGSFTGPLVDMTNTFGAEFRRCYFGAIGSFASSASALCGLKLLNTNNVVVDRCHFEDGPAAFTGGAIRGVESSAGINAFANVVKIKEVAFERLPCIVNPGLDWIVEHCVFEFVNATTGQSCIGFDYSPPLSGLGLTLRDCEYWDAAGFGTVVSVPSGVGFNLSAYSCVDESSNPNQLEHVYSHLGTGNVTIVGGNSRSTVDVGDGTLAASRKSSVVILGHTADAGKITRTGTGHVMVHILGCTDSTGSDGFIVVGHERASRTSAPTVALNAARTTGWSIAGSNGNDLAGSFTVTNASTPGNTVSSAGAVVDITFAAPVTLPATGSYADHGLAVLLSPMNDQAAVCQAYATNVTQAGFTVAVHVGITSAGTGTGQATWAYRVTQL